MYSSDKRGSDKYPLRLIIIPDLSPLKSNEFFVKNALYEVWSSVAAEQAGPLPSEPVSENYTLSFLVEALRGKYT